MREIPNFKEKVIKAYIQKIISKDEAKECLKRGFGSEELPLFYDFEEMEKPLKLYIDGLEKIGFIFPLIRIKDD